MTPASPKTTTALSPTALAAILAACVAALWFGQCDGGGGLAPTEADVLARVQERYCGTAEIRFREPFYLMVTAKDPGMTTDTAVQILKDCAFANGRIQRQGTLFIYLNVYGPDGGFLYQVCFDSQTDRFVEERRPYLEFQHY